MKFRSNRVQAIVLLAASFVPAALAAHEFKAGDLVIDHPWSRATPGGARTAAGFMTITNNGREPDRLIGATMEGVDKLEVHEMAMENNVMKMRQLESGLEIKPGARVELKPGGYHMMMIGLKSGFKKGEEVKGTLTFEKAGNVPVVFEVEAIGATGSGHK